MRFGLLLATAAALWVQPVKAAEIVQTASNTYPFWYPGIFEGFDQSLGQLTSVSLQISGSERRLFGATYPDGASEPITIDWEIDGFANFYLYNLADGVASAPLPVPISGSGQVVVTEGWSWEITAAGAATFAIDPALIPDEDGDPYPNLRIVFAGPGFYDWSDTQFTTSEPIQLNLGNGGYCAAGFGEERCNNYLYRLTYFYTPVGEVPEPATWALLLVGFGLSGAALRSRSRRRVVGSVAAA